MKRFRRIIIWVEDSPEGEFALDQAVAVARASGAALTLARAVEPPGRLFRALYAQADELHSALKREWTDRLKALAAPLEQEGLEVAVRLIEGKPFLAFIREVLRAGHDLIVKPADDATSDQFFGSTDMHLLRKCPCAIWITNREAPSSRGIVALIDPDPESEEINQRILQMAASLGEMRAAPIDVLHVWRAIGETLLAKRVSQEELTSLAEETRARSEKEFREVLAKSGIAFPNDRVHLIKGDVRYVVPEFVRRNDIGLVVMGTVSRSGIHGVLIGNTAETILSKVRCPVLTVKPQGFVSPVVL